MEKIKKQKKQRTLLKCVLAYFVGWVIMLTPIVGLTINKSDEWFKTKETSLSVSFGFVFAIVGTVILIKSKFKGNTLGIFLLLMFIATYWLKTIIEDTYLILGMLAIGYWVSLIPFQVGKRKWKIYNMEIDGKIKAQALSNVTQKYNGRV